jgi:hypothetical protein
MRRGGAGFSSADKDDDIGVNRFQEGPPHHNSANSVPFEATMMLGVMSEISMGTPIWSVGSMETLDGLVVDCVPSLTKRCRHSASREQQRWPS